MTTVASDQKGTTIEQPLASETFVKLKEPTRPGSPVENEEVRKWKSRIIASRKMRETKLVNLNRLIQYYEGIQWHLDDPNVTILKDRTTVNVIFANIKQELPELYFQNPSPIVNPRSKQFELNAFAMQELLKRYVKYNNKTELKGHIRLAILDAKFAFGCAKVTYTPRFGINPNANKPVVVGTDEFGLPIFEEDEDGNIVMESGEIITSDLYYVERVSPREILLDIKVRNFTERIEWIGHEIVKPLGYLKNHNLYTNTDFLERNVELSQVFERILNKTSDEVGAARQLSADEDTELVRFVEIYDFKNQKLLVLPDDADFFIREEKNYINPFSFLVFNEIPDEFGGVSDVSQEKPLQQEINIGRSMMITHARRSARKYAYDIETFSGVDEEEGIEAMKNPEDLTLVKVTDVAHAPVPIGVVSQDPSVFQNLIQSKIDYNTISGSTEAQRGQSERRKTGKEAKFQEAHGQVRRGDKQALVADFVVNIYKKLAKIMQGTLSVPQAVEIAGPSGMFWSEVTREDIQGEMFFDIEVSEMRPQIPEQDRQQISEFLTVIMNFLNAVFSNPIGPMVMDVQGTIKEIARTFPGINVENLLNLKVTPEQIAEQVMLQLQGGGEGGQ